MIVNPERFFKEALTRIPASTRQAILNTSPDFIQVSSAKFAENFSIQPGTIISPTTLVKAVSFRNEVVRSFTGIEFARTVDIPSSRAIPRDVRVKRDVDGRPANVISWKLRGSIEPVYAFRVDVTIGREQTVPLQTVSPNVASGESFIIRDEIYVEEIVPVSYSVTAIYNDQTESISVKSNEVYAGLNAPVQLIDRALKNWLSRTPGVNCSDKNSGIDKGVGDNPLYAGASVRSDLSDRSSVSSVNAARNTKISAPTTANNPKRPKDS